METSAMRHITRRRQRCRITSFVSKAHRDISVFAVPSRRHRVQAGAPERVRMAISGHRTRSTFEGYNMTSERALREAAR